jgi:monoterpene epsilon-lactone hydrolase
MSAETPPVPSAEMEAILEYGRTNPRPDHEDVEDRRSDVEATLFGPLADGTSAKQGILGGRPALWIRPDQTDDSDERVVLYLHGGAFEVGSPRAYQAFCSSLALRLQATVVVPDYRLAPEHPFPAAVDDVTAAYRGLIESGFPSSSVAVVGDSAGGGLVLSCLMAAHRQGLDRPASGVGMSPWVDLTLESDAYRNGAMADPFIDVVMVRRAAEHYLAGSDPTNPLASPVCAGPEELAVLPPILLQAAGNELLANDSVLLAERIADAGGDVTLDIYPTAFHVWHLGGDGIPESAQALGTLTTFVRKHWR